MSAACRPAETRRQRGKIGEFLGEFSWVEFDPMGVRGLYLSRCYCYCSLSIGAVNVNSFSVLNVNSQSVLTLD